MRKDFIAIGCLLIIAEFLTVACNPTLPSATPGGTFTIQTFFTPLTGLSYAVGGVNLTGDWVEDPPGAAGSAASVNGTTRSNGIVAFLGSRAPATWNFTWNTAIPSPEDPQQLVCKGISINITISTQQGAGEFVCVEKEVIVPLLSISPATINIANPPGTITISNAPQGGFRNVGNGNPESQYIDDNGIIEGVADSASISPNGTSITGPAPDVSSVAIGSYAGIAGNLGSGSSLVVVGGGTVHVINIPRQRCCVNGVCTC